MKVLLILLCPLLMVCFTLADCYGQTIAKFSVEIPKNIKKTTTKLAGQAALQDSTKKDTNRTTVASDTSNLIVDSSKIEPSDTATTTKDDSGGAATTTGCPKLTLISQMIEEKQDDGSYLFSIVDKKGESLSTFTLQQFDEALFDKKTADAVERLCDEALTDDDKMKVANIKNQIKTKNLYQRFLEASLEVDNKQDKAGVLDIYKRVMLYTEHIDSTFKPIKDTQKVKQKANNLLATIDSVLPKKLLHDTTGRFTAFKIQIQFQDGFIENIKVEGKIDGNNHLLKFENIYPIPFSTKNNYKNLFDTKIFEKTIFRNNNYYLRLGELLYYSENFALESKDYSPANKTTEDIVLTDSMTEITLFKDQTSKILEVKAYSDLKGVNSGNPNGLIQFELSKKLNFWSQRLRFFNSKNINWGLFNYIVPSFSVNKIENNEKKLILNHINNAAPQNNLDIPLTYASTINIFSHQNFTLGFDMSAFLIDDQAIKSTFNFGPFFYYGNVPVQDTLRIKKSNIDGTFSFTPLPDNNVNNYDINTFYWGAFANWQIFPNPKYGITITGRIMDFKALSRNFLQVKDSINYEKFIADQNGDAAKYNNYSYHKTLLSTEIFAFFKPSENNKLFFRYRFTKDMNDAKTPYRQIQIGYSTYLTKTKEVKEKNNDSPVTN